ncbi:ectonucleotide pyrophosphatase/phosphodiesterase [Dyella psychrodurans]|uniref:Alkaline phosphatase family protein n=1 Tax=Dyella psychrodurans TaxID=1927960 RepID=A0A370XBX3_9GAMM|nr:ectonucleotide pyrophosphatase/phosphodiesterase [Dyella psychrodurans]RDS85770.1 alkaline phosphatase family protein [Dyella psychrodurans]
MNWLSRVLICSFVAVGAGCASHSTTPAQATETTTQQTKATATTPLLLISIDAYRADYLDRGLSPTLQALAASGVRASMQPSFPSLTFPNHYTMVTGLVPDHHGIVNNTMFDPELGKFTLSDRKAVGNEFWWDQATPIWETADAHGIRTATMFWPGSEAPIQGHHPDYWKPFDAKVTADQRVDQVLAWLDLPADQRPGFVTLYFNAVDTAGHEHGPDSPQVNQAIQDTDEAMTRLVEGLKQRGLYDHMNIIVVADHGMASAPADNNILMDKLISMKDVDTVTLGVLAGFNPRRKHDFNAIEEQLEQPQQHMHCWDKTRVPRRLNYGSNARVPQLVCLADVGWRITTTEALAKRKNPAHVGEHGYDNADPTMQAIFVAHGPAFQNGARFHSFSNVDVYPLMAQLLRIPPRFNDGSLEDVQGMFKPTAQPAAQ